jgi:hypothetical protein
VIGSLFAIPRTPSVPKSLSNTGHVRDGHLEDQPGSWVLECFRAASAMAWGQRGAPTFQSPAIRRNVDVLLNQVPNRGGYNQGHQFGPPVLEEKPFH